MICVLDTCIYICMYVCVCLLVCDSICICIMFCVLQWMDSGVNGAAGAAVLTEKEE